VLRLHGRGVRSALEHDSTIVFGVARVGGAARVRTLKVRNAGTASATITGLAIAPGGSPFTVKTAVPLVVRPGDSVSLQLSFTPVDSLPAEGILKLQTNSGTFTVGISGRGARTLLEMPGRICFERLPATADTAIAFCNASESEMRFVGGGVQFMNSVRFDSATRTVSSGACGVIALHLQDVALTDTGRVALIYRYTAGSVLDTIELPLIADCTIDGVEQATIAAPGTFWIYPNPAVQPTSVMIAVGAACVARLYDPLGRCVRTVSALTGENSIDVSGLPAGVYRVQVRAAATRRESVLILLR
jgi:hypothetical protein